MDLNYSWSVSLVVFSLLTIILIISTLIIVMCLKRESRMFHKRLKRKRTDLNARKEENSIDISDLKKIVKYEHTFDDEKNKDRLEIEVYFYQLEQKYRGKGISDKMFQRKILEDIRTQIMDHPLDMEGHKLSYIAGRLFLKYQKKYGKQSSKKSRLQFFLLKLGHCVSLSSKFLGIFLLISLWTFVTVTDILFIHKYKAIMIPHQVFNNITMVSYQTSTVDLYYSLMVANFFFYCLNLCVLIFNFWKRAKSNNFIDKIIHR